MVFVRYRLPIAGHLQCVCVVVKRTFHSHPEVVQSASNDVIECFHWIVNSKQRKTLEAIFILPKPPSIPFADTEMPIKALAESVFEREGSRVKIELKCVQWRCHRHHSGMEAKRYQLKKRVNSLKPREYNHEPHDMQRIHHNGFRRIAR